MNTTPHVTHGPASPRRRIGIRLATIGALVALAALAGCSSGTPPKVTVTVPPPMVTASPGSGPVDPGPVGPDNPDGVILVATQGTVSPSCTNSTCWFVYLEWVGLEKGSHQVQCVTDAGSLGAWSDNSYYFDATSGERELKCFLAYPGSHVWVVIDGIYESNHVDWG